MESRSECEGANWGPEVPVGRIPALRHGAQRCKDLSRVIAQSFERNSRTKVRRPRRLQRKGDHVEMLETAYRRHPRDARPDADMMGVTWRWGSAGSPQVARVGSIAFHMATNRFGSMIALSLEPMGRHQNTLSGTPHCDLAIKTASHA